MRAQYHPRLDLRVDFCHTIPTMRIDPPGIGNKFHLLPRQGSQAHPLHIRHIHGRNVKAAILNHGKRIHCARQFRVASSGCDDGCRLLLLQQIVNPAVLVWKIKRIPFWHQLRCSDFAIQEEDFPGGIHFFQFLKGICHSQGGNHPAAIGMRAGKNRKALSRSQKGSTFRFPILAIKLLSFHNKSPLPHPGIENR